MQGWLDTCSERHHCLRGTGGTHFTPTRLLELYEDDDADPISPEHVQQFFRLVDGGRGGTRGAVAEPYVSLSHCWGPEPAEKKLRLLGMTEAMLRRGLPITRLPRLFQDAAAIAGRLGVRYLWIDRLCIVQDCEADWAAEAATMQDVYRHGFVNLAALGAADDRDGCFFERDTRHVAPALINLSPPGFPPVLYRFEGEDQGWKSAFDGALVTRAWVLQERVLSPRTLYFGRQQVFWECREANHCETVPRRNLLPPAGARIRRAPKADDGGAPVESSRKVLIDPLGWSSGDWYSIVSQYSGCGLTFATDRLIALAGLAQNFCTAKKGKKSNGHRAYLAGHWREMMPGNLVWSALTQGPRSNKHRVPSWSWASINGRIGFDRPPPEIPPVAKLIRVSARRRRKDFTGDLVYGSIRLSGPVFVAKGLRLNTLHLTPRDEYTFREFLHPETHAKLDVYQQGARVVFDTLDTYSEFTVMVIRCELNKRYATRPWSFVDVWGIAVVPSKKPKSSFRRVGYISFRVKDHDGIEDLDKDMLNKFPTKKIDII